MRQLAAFFLISAAIAQTLPGDRVITAGAVVGALSFSADGKVITAQCRDGKVRQWDAQSGQLTRTVPLEKGVGLVTLQPHSDRMAMISDGKVSVWNLQSGAVERTVAVTGRPPRRLGLSKDTQLTAVSAATSPTGSEETVRILDATGKERFAVPAGIGGTSTITFSPDGATLVASSYDTNIRAWNAHNGELLRVMEEVPVAMFAAAFSPDGQTLAMAGADRFVYLWNAKTWTLRTKLPKQPEMISSLAFSPNGKMLLTGGFSVITEKAPVKLMLWDLQAMKPVRTLDAAHRVSSVAFSSDGTLAASTSGDDQIHVWAIPQSR